MQNLIFLGWQAWQSQRTQRGRGVLLVGRLVPEVTSRDLANGLRGSCCISLKCNPTFVPHIASSEKVCTGDQPCEALLKHMPGSAAGSRAHTAGVHAAPARPPVRCARSQQPPGN